MKYLALGLLLSSALFASPATYVPPSTDIRTCPNAPAVAPATRVK